ncbi:permease of the drug/metabolite transporter superfamily [Pseudanabaena sp. lw0831]|uniref:DMT family transporter n=1 Tax=Pseudanabaena sp. lw0831 TaxID=1357935 RepID=UPI001915184D|nr:DMT family transporter [Pseudanabaena sp. lw0831]GBO52234.1 permease of the drug/metabolite transporter superfamily [Pseudanabaena sp. lw0831]
MTQEFSGISNSQNRNVGRWFLAIATLIFGASNAIATKLHDLGDAHLIDGRNPISFCNSLFVGNICELGILIFLYHREWNLKEIRKIKLKGWLFLTIVAILSGALAPALIFTALDRTAINNVILVSRIEPVLVLALSFLILKAKINSWNIAGAIATVIGVALVILLQSGSSLVFYSGEVLTVIGAIILAIASTISDVYLVNIPLGFFRVFRTLIGTLVFGTIVIALFGFEHFTDVFSPFLWQWILIYSFVIVIGGQLCWIIGLKKSTSIDITLASAFSAIAGILCSYFIVGQSPNAAQYIGGGFILLGIMLGDVGAWMQDKKAKGTQTHSAIAIDMEAGFKGV